MIPGTTPKHTFTLPFDPPASSQFCVVYAQGKEYEEKIVLELRTDRCTVEGRKIEVRLRQEETLKFDQKPHQQFGAFEPYPVKIQIGIETPNRETLWSKVTTTTVDRLLKESGIIND